MHMNINVKIKLRMETRNGSKRPQHDHRANQSKVAKRSSTQLKNHATGGLLQLVPM